MSHKTGFYEGRLGIGLANDGGDGTGNPRFPLDVNGDIRLTGAILKANGEKYLGGLTKIGFDNMTELQNGNIGVGTDAPTVLLDISGNTKISGDLNIIGTLQMNGQSPTYSNWTNSGDDIFRDSKVTIGQNSVSTTDMTLFVNGDTHINGTLSAYNIVSATTLSGSLPYTSLTGTPTTITTTQSSNITTNNAKVSSQWVTGSSSKIYYNSGNVGIGTTDPKGKLEISNSASVTSFTDYTNHSIILRNPTNSSSHNSGIVWTMENPSQYGHQGSVGIIGDAGANGLRLWGFNGRKVSICCPPSSSSNTDPWTNPTLTCWNGKVGIGTTSPGSKLSISHTRPTSITDSTDFYLGIGDGEHNHNSYRLIGFGYLSATTSVYPAYMGWITTDNGGSTKGDLVFGTRDSTGATTVPSERMRIKSNGNVGIGTTSPQTMLDVRGEGGGSSGGNCLTLRNGNSNSNFNGSQILFTWDGNPYNSSGYTHKIQSRHNSGSPDNDNAIDFYLWKNGQGAGDIGNTHGMSITASGVGIGTPDPHSSYKLDVHGHIRTMSGGIISTEQHAASPKEWTIVRYFQNGISNGGFCAIKDERTNSSSPYGDGASFGIGEKRQGNYYIGVQLRGYTCYANTSSLTNTNISDRRIKKDIEDVPDNYALQKVRDLPCRYYNYKHEPKNSEHKVVGFIAQEVKQHLPGCINEGEMPVCMPNICEFVNVTWEKIGVDERDPSKNVFKIKSSEFEEYSNLTHRFYFSNDGSKNDENVLIRESSKEEDNSFVITEIDEPYDYVYVYGASQSDFLTIKKDQIFALHHSAIQELDRKVTSLETENQELKTEVATLKAELATIKAHLGI